MFQKTMRFVFEKSASGFGKKSAKLIFVTLSATTVARRGSGDLVSVRGRRRRMSERTGRCSGRTPWRLRRMRRRYHRDGRPGREGSLDPLDDRRRRGRPPRKAYAQEVICLRIFPKDFWSLELLQRLCENRNKILNRHNNYKSHCKTFCVLLTKRIQFVIYKFI